MMSNRLLSILGVVLASAACGPGEGNVGSARLELSISFERAGATRAMLSGLVDTIRVTVSAQGTVLRQQSFDYEALQGTVTDIPVGTGRTFTVEALGNDTRIYSGTADNITIAKNQTASVPVVLAPAYSSDVYPPAAVTDLIARGNGTTVTLTWTASGNDARAGQAHSYDLRISPSTIQAANFDAATQVSDAPAPGVAGQAEQYVHDFGTSGTYHFALKVRDDAGNWSAISNEAIVTLTGPDTMPPATVANLTVFMVGSDSVTLTWTAPGDDGSAGTVTDYDLRWSTAEITAGNFSSATRATGPAQKVPGGQTESVVVNGLTPGTRYWFALKAVDDADNWSAMSNVVNALIQDQTPPAQVTDLRETAQTATSITLGWTAPGDDGASGIATRYDIRYAATEITSANFTQAQAVQNPPAPQVAGAAESVTIAGLTQGQPYYFALKAYDDEDNEGPMSNVATATPGVVDTTPPADVTNLAVQSVAETSVTLAWTAPGDDGSVGTVTSYDVRMSTAEITAANFDTAQPVAGPSTIVSAGLSQTLVVDSLTRGTPYWFALKAADERNNSSGISNVISATPDDVTAPQAVTDLAAVVASDTSATLTWKAPYDDSAVEAVTRYDIRWSTSTIDEQNFTSATQVLNPPAPLAPGSDQLLVVDSLPAGATVYFAIKAFDVADNASALSNPASAAMRVVPSAVTTLSVSAVADTGVTLTWKAPHDDTATEAVAAYEIRYSTGTIDDGNFDQATLVTNPPTPQAPESDETLVVSPLNINTPYTFALVAIDEHGNRSALSNVISGEPGSQDTTPPAAIDNLAAAPTATAGEIQLSWTAPGDDGAGGGPVASYDVRYSTSPIDDANFASATQVFWSGTIADPASQQTFLVTGLTSATVYYFAVKGVDNRGLLAPLSNVPSATPN